ncbi:MAG: glycosyltransferase, partial [Alphaproteobacteria bacterium]
MKKTQRILFLTPNMERGEIGDYVADLSQYLQKEKGLPVVISAGGYETLRLRRNGITHIQAPLHSINPFSILKSLSEIDKAIKKYQINLIHVHSRLTAFLAYYISKKYAIPVVATAHYSYGLSQKRGSWIERLKMLGMQHANHVITSFRYLQKILIQATDIKEKNISHVSRWVDTNHFSAENISAERLISLTEKWNVPDGLPLILNISEESEANDYLFLEALSKLPHRNFCVLMIRNWASGKSPLKSRIERKAQELKLYKNLSIVLPEDDEPLMYKLSDLIICSSRTSFARIALQTQI